MAALAAAILEDAAPATGIHAGAKAVRASPANVVRLVSAFHGLFPVKGSRRKAPNTAKVKCSSATDNDFR